MNLLDLLCRRVSPRNPVEKADPSGFGQSVYFVSIPTVQTARSAQRHPYCCTRTQFGSPFLSILKALSLVLREHASSL